MRDRGPIRAAAGWALFAIEICAAVASVFYLCDVVRREGGVEIVSFVYAAGALIFWGVLKTCYLPRKPQRVARLKYLDVAVILLALIWPIGVRAILHDLTQQDHP